MKSLVHNGQALCLLIESPWFVRIPALGKNGWNSVKTRKKNGAVSSPNARRHNEVQVQFSLHVQDAEWKKAYRWGTNKKKTRREGINQKKTTNGWTWGPAMDSIYWPCERKKECILVYIMCEKENRLTDCRSSLHHRQLFLQPREVLICDQLPDPSFSWWYHQRETR